MSRLTDLLLHPEKGRDAEPAHVGMRLPFLIGSGVWLVALIAAVLGWAGGEITAPTVATCVVGLLIGAAGLTWAARRERRTPTERPGRVTSPTE